MPSIAFTHHLRRHAPAEPLQLPGATPRAVLDGVFASYPALRGYVLDEHGGLRKHVALFVDGELRRDGLDTLVDEAASIYVMQALSGG